MSLEAHTWVGSLVASPKKKDDAVFVNSSSTDEQEHHTDNEQITLARAYWEDMGQPETITVTVKPGETVEEDIHEQMMLYAEIVPSHDGQFFVRGMAKNGERLWVSETYHDIRDAKAHAYSYGVEVKENQDG